MGKTKYTVTFPDKVSKVIDEISEEDSISKPEVLRRAVSIYRFLHDAVKENRKICLIDKDNESVVKEIIFN